MTVLFPAPLGYSSSAAVRRPGFDNSAPARERYFVPARGHLVLELQQGDKLEILDQEGGQEFHLTGFSHSGRWDPDALSFGSSTPVRIVPAAQLQRAMRGEAFASLRLRGVELEAVSSAFAGLGGESVPGEQVECEALRPMVLLVVAPPPQSKTSGESSAPIDGPQASDLRVYVTRAISAETDFERQPPAPLAEPRLDMMVPRRSGRAYEVKAGEYIQVIDIAGRQCSDFIAFSARALDKGRERFIDSTVTRTMVGRAYPNPGLTDKFYDQDNQPLVQVIQDSCGRHDTYGLACTARVYENKGFPGHVNCSTNISEAMRPWGVAPRAAWPAINYFFNTQVDAGNVILSGEGWSLPGDYVLMRALTDLVCVSTACPDDTSPINGWNPTDVQLRIYNETEMFRKSIAFRATPDSDAVMTKETPFHPKTSALTRDYRAAKDFWIPGSYTATGVLSEYWACRDAATIQDMSQLGKVDVTGPGAEALMDHALPRDVRRAAVGQVLYSPMCRSTGAMFDDGTLFRLSPESFRWMAGDAQAAPWLRELAASLDLDVQVRTATSSLCNLAVQGPRSREILSSLIWTADGHPRLEELKWFRFLVGRVGDFNGPAVLVSRSGFTGELGYEVFTGPDDAPAVWDAIMEAGEPMGLVPMGLEALDLLRIEAALPVAGHEFDDAIDPFEAGAGFAVPLKKKDRDFVGREALIRNASAQRNQLVGLVLTGQDCPNHGDPVFRGRTQVGVVTSACRSPHLGQPIAMARIAVEAADVNGDQADFEIGQLDGQLKRLAARQVPLPFYDPQKLKPRA